MIGDNETSRKESRGELFKVGVEEMVSIADSSSLTLVSRSGVCSPRAVRSRTPEIRSMTRGALSSRRVFAGLAISRE